MMTLEVSNNLFVSDAPSSFVSELKATLTIENPEYLAAEKMGRWTGNTPRYLRHYELVDDGIIVPRGLIGHDDYRRTHRENKSGRQ